MRLKMLVALSGATCINPGEEAEFERAEAIRLIEAGIAVPAELKVERAVQAKPRERRIK